MNTHTPVAMIIFRRPDLTKKVFDVIREVKPPKLFIYADGPSPARPGEDEKCAAAQAVCENVDWDCEVVRDYSPTNMGPWRRIASGITAAFEQVEELIILEDDCCPHPTFFRFCDELLERYREDERIMHICGHHLQQENPRNIPYSYSYAWANVAWGYATWRRAWKHFDLALPNWPELRDTDFLEQFVADPNAIEVYTRLFDELHAHPGEVDGYDYSWSYACWTHYGLSIVPSVSLVQNGGYGPESTHFHTSNVNDPRFGIEAKPMTFPLRHPPYVIRDTAVDQFIFGTYFQRKPVQKSFVKRAYRKVHRSLSTAITGLRA